MVYKMYKLKDAVEAAAIQQRKLGDVRATDVIFRVRSVQSRIALRRLARYLMMHGIDWLREKWDALVKWLRENWDKVLRVVLTLLPLVLI